MKAREERVENQTERKFDIEAGGKLNTNMIISDDKNYIVTFQVVICNIIICGKI